MSRKAYDNAPRSWAKPFAAALFAMFALQMSSLGFSPLLPAIQKTLAVSYSQIGLFTGLYGIIAIVLSYPAGALVKKFGEKNVLVTGLLVAALGLGALSLASTFNLALSARIVWLIGYRISFVCVLSAIVLTCPKSLKGSMMGILGAVSGLASVVGAPFGSLIGAALGWRRSIAAYGVMAILGSLQFWFLYRSKMNRGENTGLHGSSPSTAPPDSKPAYRVPLVWALAVLLGCSNAGGFSVTFFVPAALHTKFGLNAVDASFVISEAYIFAIFANIVCGYIMDRLDRWFVMASIAAITLCSTFALASSSLLVFKISVILIIGTGLVLSNQIYGIAGEVLPGRNTGPVMGIVGLGAGVFGYVAPQMIGFLRDHTGGFGAGWRFLSVLSSIALLEFVFLRHYAMKQARLREVDVPV